MRLTLFGLKVLVRGSKEAWKETNCDYKLRYSN